MRNASSRSIALLMVAGLGIPTTAQNQKARKLGPETAKSIQEATVDPAFRSTVPLKRIVLLPFANAAQFTDAAGIISKNLVAQLAQLRSDDFNVVPPDELMNFISTSKLDDQFNVFLGDYLDAGTVRQEFLEMLRVKQRADAVLVGKILGYGETKASGRGFPLGLGSLFGSNSYVVGLEMGLYRVTDGRRIWRGKDVIDAQKSQNLQAAASLLGEVFARFIGRSPYQ